MNVKIKNHCFLRLSARVLVLRCPSTQSSLPSTLLSRISHSCWCEKSSPGGTKPLYKLILYTLAPICYLSPAKPGSCPATSPPKHDKRHLTNCNRKSSLPHGKGLLLGWNMAHVKLHTALKLLPQIKMSTAPGKFKGPMKKTVHSRLLRQRHLQHCSSPSPDHLWSSSWNKNTVCSGILLSSSLLLMTQGC